MEKWQEKLRFRTIKNKFWERLDSTEEEIELREIREITRKKINYIERLETEIKETEELVIEGGSKSIDLLFDLNLEKGFEIDEIMEIEIIIEKLKIPKTTINAIKRLVIPEKYLYRIS